MLLSLPQARRSHSQVGGRTRWIRRGCNTDARHTAHASSTRQVGGVSPRRVFVVCVTRVMRFSSCAGGGAYERRGPSARAYCGGGNRAHAGRGGGANKC